ncbi:MAG: NAD(P)H-dependent glycerol-3-phosphate dehydrogenase, partial [Cyanobacteria bacterium P01_D01_bin.56]
MERFILHCIARLATVDQQQHSVELDIFYMVAIPIRKHKTIGQKVVPLVPRHRLTHDLTVLGAGAWGSALAYLANYAQNRTLIWSRRGEVSLDAAISAAPVLLSAISMKGVRPTIDKIRKLGLSKGTVIVTATKGFDPETFKTPSQLWQAAFPDNPVVVLSGPNLSKEIVAGLPSATVVSSSDQRAAEQVQKLFASDCFRVYTNADPLGTELGGTLKNVVAIAVGICDGLKLGTNAKAALMTRALSEIMGVGIHLGAKPETFIGLAGLGDMLATCSSNLSRNFRVGYGLAQGKSLQVVLTELQSTAEGVNTAHVLMRLAKKSGVAIPVTQQ